MSALTVDVHKNSDCGSDVPFFAKIEFSSDLKAKIEKMVAACNDNDLDGCYSWDNTPVFLDEDETESDIRLSYCRLQVYKDGDFAWCACEKHSEVEFETDMISQIDLCLLFAHEGIVISHSLPS